MALSGSCGNTFRTGYRLQIDWTATQDIANNKSTVTAKLYLISLGSSYYINASALNTNHIKIDGTTYSNSTTSAVSANEKRLLFTTSKVITHNSDGTKTFSLGGDRYMNVTLSGVFWGTVTIANTNFTLDTIPRASIINHVDTLSNVAGSASLNVVPSMTVYSTSFNLDFVLKIGSTTIKSWSNVTVGSTGTQDINLSLSTSEQDTLMSYMPTVTSATLTLTCQTQSGSTNIGPLQSKTFTVNLNTSAIAPTFDTVSSTENDSSVSALGIGFVQNLSEIILAMVNCSVKKSATISSYKITYKGIVYNSQSITTPTIDWTSISVSATLTDSRGLTCTKSVNLTAIEYTPPNLVSFTVKRINSDGSENDIGTSMQVYRKGSVISLSSQNQYSYVLYSRERGTTDWGSAIAQGTSPVGSISMDQTQNITSAVYDPVKSYDVRLDFSDKFNTTISIISLSTGVVVMSWSKTGVGIGKVWEQGALDVGGDINVSNDIHIGNFIDNLKQSSNTSSSYANYYAKLLSIKVTSQFGDGQIGGVLYNHADGSADIDCANFYVRMKQQAAMGSAPNIDIHLQNNRGYFEIYGVLVSNTADLTQLDIYIKITSSYRVVDFSPIFKNGDITAYSNEALVASLPSGTQYTADKNLYEAGSALSDKYLLKGASSLVMCNNDGFYYDDTNNIMYTTMDGTNYEDWNMHNCSYGSNSNGEYLKYADGTMICWKSVGFSSIPVTNGGGSGTILYYSDVVSLGVLPATFASTPKIVKTLNRAGGHYLLWLGNASSSELVSTTSWGSIRLNAISSLTATYVYIDCFAIGRWK